jgi:photosystem II stability/assembly factor-like uncharacterized protein
MRRRRKTSFIAAGLIIACALVLTIDHHLRWRIWLRINRVAQMEHMPLDTAGYVIERLPFSFNVSFARHHDVYFGDANGSIYKGDDTEHGQKPLKIGETQIGLRMLFVSSRGTIFVSGENAPLLRSTDGGKTWQISHDWSFWRMTEDEERHILYAGNYSPQRHPVYMAKVFKSSNEGKTWETIFADDRLDHIHSVAWDPVYHNLYLSAGDTSYRGQAYSSDFGRSWHWLNSGGKQGHTDIAISAQHVFWGTDDNLGRILRAPRAPVHDGDPVLWQPYHHVWWIVAQDRQIYAGTFTGEGRRKDTGAFLVASSDDGETWQRLLEDTDGESRFDALNGESRRLSAGGWLYFATTSGKNYRVRSTVMASR